MNRSICKLIAVLIFIQIVTGAIFTHDPATGAASVTIQSRDPDGYNWLIKRTITAGSSYSFESVRFDKTAPANNKISYTYATSKDNTVKAVSRGYTCAALFDATSGSQKLAVVNFLNANNVLQQDLVASTFPVTGATANAKTYQVADSCLALRVDNAIYHYDSSISTAGATKYVADTLPSPAWTNPAFTSDFAFVVGDSAIYMYNPLNKTYVNIFNSTFYTNKRLWVNQEGLVILSWVDTATTNVKNYSVQAFAFPGLSGTSFARVARIDGQYYDTVANAAPTISLSQTLRTIVVYGKSAATTFFARGKSIDYLLQTSVDFTIPSWITATQSAVSVSDQYIYARNLVDNAATPPVKEQGAYFIGTGVLTPYLAPVTVVNADGITDWVRTRVLEGRSGELYLVREHVTSAKVITLEELTTPPPAAVQVFSWDKKNNVLTSTITGANTFFSEITSRPQWFLWAQVSASVHQFYSVRAHPSTFALVKSTFNANQNHVLKAVSFNDKCALIYDSVTPALKAVNFVPTPTATAFATIPASLYTGIDLTAAATTFDVSDNCKAFRINNKIFHYNDGDSTYYLDTYPNGTTSLTNPVFSEDFSIAVTDSGIYKYTAKTATADGIYTVDRAETFDTQKSVVKVGNNYIIASTRQVNLTHYAWKIQLNTISNSLSTKVGEFSGTVQVSLPEVYISPRLSKIIVKGNSATNSSQRVYVAKTIDWPNKVVKDIVLPTAITSIDTSIAVNDQFLYANNIYNDKKHSAYAIMGTTCIQTLNQNYPFPTVSSYYRTILLPDPSGERKLILAHQYNTDDFIRLLKSQRKSVAQFFNPNPASNSEMTFSYSGGAEFKYTSFPYFGKWFYTTSTGTTVNYVEYDPTAANKKKTITKTGLTGNNLIKAVSPTFDCAVTFVAGSDLNTVRINSTDSSATTLSAWANVVTSNDITAANLATAITAGRIGVGSNCWALRADYLVYFRNAGNTAYTKSAIIAGLTTPVFDASLNFAYAGGKVYKYTSPDYAEAINVTGLKSTVKLYASADNNKLIILSYEPTAVGASSYNGVLKVYANFNGTFLAGSLPPAVSTFTTYNGVPSIFANPTFEIIGVTYTGGSAAANSRPVVFSGSVDYTTGQMKEISIPRQLTAVGVGLGINVYGDYIHVLQSFNSQYSENIFKVDKSIGKLILVRSRPVTMQELTNVKNLRIFEEGGNLIAIYESQSGTDVTLLKRVIGSQTQRQAVSGISSRDAGLLVQNGQVQLCPAGCSYCLNPNSCETCLNGFALDSSKSCLRCAPLCKTCASTDLSTCTSCLDGYYESSGACLRCSENCVTCSTSSANCLTCRPGYYVSSGACIPCVDNCVSCNPVTATDALCDTCRKGFVYSTVSQTCVKCVAGCSVCNPERVYECVSCANGYETVTTNNTVTCTKCPNNCNTCSGGTCQECRTGFRLSNNTCVAQCRLPCQECSITDPTNCTSCVGGYTFNNQTCVPDLTCNNNKTCTSCPLGYNLVLGVCYQCNGGDNCRTCDNTNIEVCASCNRGFYLTSTYKCKACNITGCSTCSNEVYCDECKSGYVLSGSSAGKCIKCDDSCATCFDSPTNCETCAVGFTKKGWNCINNNNIKVELKINADIATFTTSNYTSIEQEICDKIGKDPKHVNIDQLKSGSVVMITDINVDNTAQQATLLSSLQTLLSTGSTVGGFSIESSTLVAVTNGQQTIYSDSDAKKYRDIAIIVGIVIPVGLIILFIIFFILYKKGAICANNGSKVGQHSMDSIQVQQYK